MPKVRKIITKNVPEDKKEGALADYLKLVQSYKVQNPVKFEGKKEHFMEVLKSLGFKGEL